MTSNYPSEKAIVSACMSNLSLLSRAAADGIDSTTFWHPDTKAVWRALHEVTPDDNGRVDLVTFATHLDATGTLDAIGGGAGLAELSSYHVSPSGWSQWVAALREAQVVREARLASSKLDSVADSEEALAEVSAITERLRTIASGKRRSVSAKQATEMFIDVMRENARGRLPGHSTGIDELDRICGGMRPGEFWVVAGKPSRGKSVLMLQIACQFVRDGKTVSVHSLEMMEHEIIARLCSCIGHIDYGSITQPASAPRHDLVKIKGAAQLVMDSKVFIDASAGQTLDTIRAEAERVRDTEGKIDLVVVDYLQLVRSARSSRESREEEVARVSGGLKQLAKALRCPVISASQLNDNNQVRESRAIEQDADALLFIADDGIKVGKMRNGKRDSVLPLILDGTHQQFKQTNY